MGVFQFVIWMIQPLSHPITPHLPPSVADAGFPPIFANVTYLKTASIGENGGNVKGGAFIFSECECPLRYP